MARACERGRSVVDEEVDMTHHLVEVVEAAARSFQPLERLAELARGRHRRVVAAGGAPIERTLRAVVVHEARGTSVEENLTMLSRDPLR